MPRLTGLELLEKMRRDPALADIPVVMYSAGGTDAQKRRARELGALAWIEKPHGCDQFRAYAQQHDTPQPST